MGDMSLLNSNRKLKCCLPSLNWIMNNKAIGVTSLKMRITSDRFDQENDESFRLYYDRHRLRLKFVLMKRTSLV